MTDAVADLPGMVRQGALQAVLDALEDSDIPAAAAIVKTLMAAAGVPESDSIGRDGNG